MRAGGRKRTKVMLVVRWWYKTRTHTYQMVNTKFFGILYFVSANETFFSYLSFSHSRNQCTYKRRAVRRPYSHKHKLVNSHLHHKNQGKKHIHRNHWAWPPFMCLSLSLFLSPLSRSLSFSHALCVCVDVRLWDLKTNKKTKIDNKSPVNTDSIHRQYDDCLYCCRAM